MRDKIEELKSKIPEDLWKSVRNSALESGNQGIWAMCMVAVEELAEFWKDEHE